MATYNLGNVADRAYQGLNDVPTAISGAVMETLAYQALLFVNNYTKNNVGSNAIDETHLSPVVNLTKAWTLARMANVGTNVNWKIGELQIDEGTSNAEAQQIKIFYETAIMELKSIGRPIAFSKANG